MTKHRIAIVGTGNSVNNHLAAAAAVADRAELVAAVDLDLVRVQAVCDAHQIPRAYTSVTEMLAQEQPHLVCIVTPPSTHKDLAIQCLEAGAWVYCEKPLCASLAEFDAILDAEARTGGYVSTVFQWRFGAAGKHLKQLMQAQALGKPLVAVCNTLWYRKQDYYDVSWRGKFKTEFGGPTMTLGIHLMDLLLWLMSDWQSVQAAIGTLDRAIEVEDVSAAIVRFASGGMGTIVNSALSPRQESYLRLDFQKATAEVSALYRYTNANWTFTPADPQDAATIALWDQLGDDFGGTHSVQLAELLDSMEAGTRPAVSGDEARRIIEFVAALYKSAFTGLPVQQGEITPDDAFYYANNGAAEMTGDR